MKGSLLNFHIRFRLDSPGLTKGAGMQILLWTREKAVQP